MNFSNGTQLSEDVYVVGNAEEHRNRANKASNNKTCDLSGKKLFLSIQPPGNIAGNDVISFTYYLAALQYI